MSPVINEAASIGVNDGSIDSAMTEVYEASYGEFDSQSTVDTVRTAIKNITGTKEFKSLPNEEKLAFLAVEANLRRKVGPKSQTTTEKVAKSASKISEKFEVFKDTVGETGTVVSSALKAINAAFVNLVNTEDKNTGQLLLTGQTKVSDDTITVRETPGDKSSKVIASIRKTPQIEKFKELLQASQITGRESGDTSGLKSLVDALTSGEVLKSITAQVGSTDPVVIQALLTYFAEDLAKPEFAEEISKNLKAALENKTDVKSEPKAEVKAENKQESKSTDTSEQKQEVKKEFEIDENGEKMVYSKEAISEEDTSFVDSLLNPVCGI